ncbi:MAG: hypothetical protein JXA33_00280 [Anaerolineae bacterium]|nr:hypothetical protein [Anaerolineae bacterium]
MSDKQLNRREFLKLVVAGAAAAGLSHFRFLNFDGVQPVLADRECEPGSGEVPDQCIPLDGNVDWCVPDTAAGGADPDYCQPTGDGTDPDMCPDTSGSEPPDICSLAADPDYCNPEKLEADTCDAVHGEPDICIGDSEGDGDLCIPAAREADVCILPTEPEDTAESDECDPLAAEPVPDVCLPGTDQTDVCNPAMGESDVCGVTPTYDPDICIGDSSGDGDFCFNDGTISDPDICAPPEESDQCDPTMPEDPDEPNSVKFRDINSFASTGVTTFGVAAAILGAAIALGSQTPSESTGN